MTIHMGSEDLRKYHLSKMFWAGERLPHPLMSFHIRDYIISSKYRAAKDILVHGKSITPDMLDVDAFIEDYDRMLRVEEQTPGDVFLYTGAFSGIPWMEAICGCGVKALEDCTVSVPCLESPSQYEQIRWDPENPWIQKYLEFLEKTRKAFKGKYAIAETLLRGCVDVCGALLGQTEMIYAMSDEPENVTKLLQRINLVFIQLVDTLITYSEPVATGYIGPYGLWYPGRPLYFQEDLTSLVTPLQYRELVKPIHDRMCRLYARSVVHLHTTSFHCLEDFLRIPHLSIIQMNKDDGGPSISEMIPYMKKVQQAGKGLVVSAGLTLDEIDHILEEVEIRAVILDLFAGSAEEAATIKEYVYGRCGRK